MYIHVYIYIDGTSGIQVCAGAYISVSISLNTEKK